MQSPSISCPAPATLECAGASTPFEVAAASSDNCASSSVQCAPSPFALGTSAAACTAVDAAGNQSSCSAMVTVVDTKPPVIGSLTATPSGPGQGHRMVPVSVAVSAVDACAGGRSSCRIVSVSSNQPRRHRKPDYEITGPLTVNLRAGHDAVFTITVRGTDPSGNFSEKATTVVMRKLGKDSDGDDGGQHGQKEKKPQGRR